jgi:hypothetical protein
MLNKNQVMPKHRVKLLQCPNCQTPLPNAENFCPTCGQENHEIIRPASHLWTELMGNIFNVDSRFFHTIKALFFSPGKLTREYNAGKRKYYLPPIRIYLLASVLFFLAQSVAMKLSNEQLIEIKKEFTDNPSDSTNINLFNKKIRMTKLEMLELSQYKREALDSFLITHDVEPTFFNRVIVRQGSKAVNGQINGLSETFQQFLSFGMFLFMPIFGLLLMLFYRKQKRFYVEHLIFSIHLHSIGFFIFTLNTLLGFLPLSIIHYFTNIFGIILFAYFLFSLKYIYQESWAKTIFKLLGLSIIYGIISSIGLTVIALLALFVF